jgi:hypothetical protein
MLDLADSDLTYDQLDKCINDIRDSEYAVEWLRLTGGEPLLHPKFKTIMDVVEQRLVKTGLVKSVQINTNCTLPMPPFPSDRWRTLSSHPSEKHHLPFTISPLDVDIRGRKAALSCDNQSHCGIAYDYRGWSFCQKAANLARTIGVNASYPNITLKMDRRVCSHCFYSLPNWAMYSMRDAVEDGRLVAPSSTIATGLARDPQLRSSAKHLVITPHEQILQRAMSYYRGNMPGLTLVEFATSKPSLRRRKRGRRHYEYFGATYRDVGLSAVDEMYRKDVGTDLRKTTEYVLPWMDASIVLFVMDWHMDQSRRRRRRRNYQYWVMHNAYSLLRNNGILACAFPDDRITTQRWIEQLGVKCKMILKETWSLSIHNQPYIAAIFRKGKRHRGIHKRKWRDLCLSNQLEVMTPSRKRGGGQRESTARDSCK